MKRATPPLYTFVKPVDNPVDYRRKKWLSRLSLALWLLGLGLLALAVWVAVSCVVGPALLGEGWLEPLRFWGVPPWGRGLGDAGAASRHFLPQRWVN